MYTFEPQEKFAKAHNRNARISTKSAAFLCKAIRGKKLTVARRLLSDLAAEKRGLDGKYYTKTAEAMSMLLASCEKNAEFKGLDAERLFVHASAHQGTTLRRRRRKASFGSRMKSTHVEMMLIEKGKVQEKVSKEKRAPAKTSAEKQIDTETAAARKSLDDVKAKTADLQEKTETLDKAHSDSKETS